MRENSIAAAAKAEPRLGNCFCFRAVLPLAAVVEAVLANIGHQPQAQVIAGVIQDEAVALARRGAEAAADLLHKQNAALCRLGVDDAARMRKVDARRQHADIADDLGFA